MDIWALLWAFLTMSTQKNIVSAFSFLILYQYTKNQFILSAHFWDTVNFRELWPDRPWPHLKAFDFCESVSTCKQISLSYLFILQLQLIFEFCDQIGLTRYWPSQPKNFQSLFNLCEFAPDCMKLVYFFSSFLRCSRFWGESPEQIGHAHAQPKKRWSNFNFYLYEHAKNEVLSSMCSGEIV